MTHTATDILNHCKAVVNGEIPQPELMRVEVRDDFKCFIYHKDSRHLIWAFSLKSNEAEVQLAARLLGLPAPVVLEWVDGEDKEIWEAQFNGCIKAVIGQYGTNRFWAKVFVDNHENTYFTNEGSFHVAESLCRRTIQQIITPTPKP